VDLFHLEQISSKKSDWVKLTGHSFFLSELVEICYQLLGGGGSNDYTVGATRNLSGRPALERSAPTIYGSLTVAKIALQASQPVDVSGFASGCRVLCKWVVSGLQVA
jgi:hypothetical protein